MRFASSWQSSTSEQQLRIMCLPFLQIFMRMGIPCAMSSDQGREFNNAIKKELAGLLGIRTNRHETSTALWNPYRRVSLRGQGAQIRFNRGARGNKQKTTVRHFGFTEKVYGLPCTVRTMLLWKCHHRNAVVHISFFTGRHSSGSSPKAGCLCSYIYIYIYVRVASRNRTLGTLKRNGVFTISVYLHAFCTILRSLVALGTSVTEK